MTPPIDPMLATDVERRQQVALFRYGTIADLVQLPLHLAGPASGCCQSALRFAADLHLIYS